MRILLFITLVLVGFRTEAQDSLTVLKTIDSLKKIIKETTDDSVKIEAYKQWDGFIYTSNPNLDLEINEKILSISEKKIVSLPPSSPRFRYFFLKKGESLNIIGLINNDNGNFKVAQDNFQVALKIAESVQDTNLITSALNNLGIIMQAQGNYEKSIYYYEKCLDLTKNNDEFLGIYLNNIGLAYLDLGKPTLALVSFRSSLSHSQHAKDKINQANTLGNIAETHYRHGNKDSSYLYMDEALEIDNEIGLSFGGIFRLNKLGTYYAKENRSSDGIKYCLEAEKLNQELYTMTNDRDCHECLYYCYRDLGRIDLAFYHIEEYHKLKDSLLSDETKKELLKSEYAFSYEKQRIADSLAISSQQKIKEVQLNADLKTKSIIQYVLFAGIAGLVLIAIVLYRNFRLKQKDNEIIAAQKRIVENQKHLVEEKNQEITDSITYAKRLQEAILPSHEKIKTLLPDSFVMYLPKDIVAGDFYWIEETEDKVLFAIADCTGHGVPGALVSVVCNNSLNRAVREFKLIHPSEILDKTRELVIETFKSSNATVKDGMDIALCCFNLKTRDLEYAGANNSLYLLRSGELVEFKADKEPIGTFTNPTPFTNHVIPTQDNDQIFLFTDGFADQFGGEKGKKYKYKPFKEFLIGTAHNSAIKQKASLENEFSRWLGDYDQIDDVCVMGVKFIIP